MRNINIGVVLLLVGTSVILLIQALVDNPRPIVTWLVAGLLCTDIWLITAVSLFSMWRISSISASLDVAGISTNYGVLKVYTVICLGISIITTIETSLEFFINELKKNDDIYGKTWHRLGTALSVLSLM